MLKLSAKEAIEYLQSQGLSLYKINKTLGFNSPAGIYGWLKPYKVRVSVEKAYKLYEEYGILLDDFNDEKHLKDLYKQYLKYKRI